MVNQAQKITIEELVEEHIMFELYRQVESAHDAPTDKLRFSFLMRTLQGYYMAQFIKEYDEEIEDDRMFIYLREIECSRYKKLLQKKPE